MIFSEKDNIVRPLKILIKRLRANVIMVACHYHDPCVG